MKKNMKNKVATGGNDIRGCTERVRRRKREREREREGWREANHPKVISCQFSSHYQKERTSQSCGAPTKAEERILEYWCSPGSDGVSSWSSSSCAARLVHEVIGRSVSAAVCVLEADTGNP